VVKESAVEIESTLGVEGALGEFGTLSVGGHMLDQLVGLWKKFAGRRFAVHLSGLC
jgi:hypothetical protein